MSGVTEKGTAAARYLPRGKARGAHQMSTRLNLDVFVILCTDLTELESGAHFTIQFILFLEYREKGPMLTVFEHEVLLTSNFLNYNELLQFPPLEYVRIRLPFKDTF